MSSHRSRRSTTARQPAPDAYDTPSGNRAARASEAPAPLTTATPAIVEEADPLHEENAALRCEQATLREDTQTLATRLGDIENLLRQLVSGRDLPPHFSRTPRRGSDTSSEGERSDYRDVPPFRPSRTPGASLRATSVPEPAAAFKPAKVKPKDPDLYDGTDSRKLSSYITQVRMYCDVLGSSSMNDESMILWTAGYLRGNAFAWWEPHYAQPRASRPSWMFDFELFVRELQTVFGDPDRQATAEREIRHLTQGRSSVSEYYSRFMMCAGQVQWNEPALRSQFEYGLNREVRQALAFKDPQPRTLEDVVGVAVRLDNNVRNLRERQNEHRSTYNEQGPRLPHSSKDNRRERSSSTIDNQTRTSNPPPSVRSGSSKPNQPYADDRKKRREDQPWQREVVCYSCNKPGHYATECTEKRPNRDASQQFNAVRIDEPDVKEDGRDETNHFEHNDAHSGSDSGNEEPL